jgi:hypothetical protein
MTVLAVAAHCLQVADSDDNDLLFEGLTKLVASSSGGLPADTKARVPNAADGLCGR